MRTTIILLTLTCKFFSQTLIAPSSTIPCLSWYTSVTVTPTSGQPPYNYTVHAPSCSTSFTGISISASKVLSLTCPGVYTVVVNDVSNNPVGTMTHTVYSSTSLSVPVLNDASRDTICLGTFASLYTTIDGLGGPLTGWSFSPFTWSSGDIGYTTIVSPTVTTTYSVSGLVTATLNTTPPQTKTCTLQGSRKVIPVELGQSTNCYTVGIVDFAKETYQLQFYPNPTRGNLHFRFEAEFPPESLSVINVIGQVVSTKEWPEVGNELNLSELPKGVYYLIFKAQNGYRRSFKFILD